jgi:hypothetical protein
VVELGSLSFKLLTEEDQIISFLRTTEVEGR